MAVAFEVPALELKLDHAINPMLAYCIHSPTRLTVWKGLSGCNDLEAKVMSDCTEECDNIGFVRRGKSKPAEAQGTALPMGGGLWSRRIRKRPQDRFRFCARL